MLKEKIIFKITVVVIVAGEEGEAVKKKKKASVLHSPVVQRGG